MAEITKNMLVPSDYSQHCFLAVSYALDFCRHYGFNLEVFHVFNGKNNTPFYERTCRALDLYREKFSVNSNIVTRVGELVQTIVGETNSVVFDLLILGTPGNSGLQSVTGSYAAKIISSVDIPVLVVHGKPFCALRKIVCVIPEKGFQLPIAKINSLVEIFGAKVFVMCSSNDDNINQDTTKNDNFVWEYVDYKGYDFLKKGISYSEEIGADAIMVLHTLFNSGYDFMIFNSLQIPVLCV